MVAYAFIVVFDIIFHSLSLGYRARMPMVGGQVYSSNKVFGTGSYESPQKVSSLDECTSSCPSKRCVSFSDDHGFPLEHFHLIDAQTDRKDSFTETYGNGSFGSMLKNASEAMTNAGLVVVMVCVVIGSYAL